MAGGDDTSNRSEDEEEEELLLELELPASEAKFPLPSLVPVFPSSALSGSVGEPGLVGLAGLVGLVGLGQLADDADPPLLIITMVPVIETPAGLITTLLLPTTRVKVVPASMVTDMPPLRSIDIPAL